MRKNTEEKANVWERWSVGFFVGCEIFGARHSTPRPNEFAHPPAFQAEIHLYGSCRCRMNLHEFVGSKD